MHYVFVESTSHIFGNIIIDNCAIEQALKTGNSVIDRDV